MRVKFFASFAELTKEKERDFSAPDIKTLLKIMTDHYGQKFEDKLYRNGELNPTLVILVNGKHIRHLQGLETTLLESDEVAFFPMLSGG